MLKCTPGETAVCDDGKVDQLGFDPRVALRDALEPMPPGRKIKLVVSNGAIRHMRRPVRLALPFLLASGEPKRPTHRRAGMAPLGARAADSEHGSPIVEESVLGLRYRTIEKIGAGGMADVYRAIDEVLGRTVAVKVMHARLASDPEFAARFRQEARAVANLTSPNIVNVYDWGQDAETYYLVMEYVHGCDLKQIEREGELTSSRVAEIGAQVCSALCVAHGYDVIHRDIKPHNIMVQPDGAVRVMDFGIARTGNTSMTQTSSVLGTPQYISPEQARGAPLTAASDLYSLGVVLYEAATGRLPFDADNAVSVALMHVSEQAAAPNVVNPGIDRELGAVIIKAMEKDPADRYASADEMGRALRAVAQRPQAAGPVAVPILAPEPMDEAATTVLRVGARTAVMPPIAETTKLRVNASPSRSRIAHARRRNDGAASKPVSRRRGMWPWLLAAALLAASGLAIALGTGLLGAGRSVPVPDLGAKSSAEAQAALSSAGMTMGGVTETFGPSAEAGLVVDQSPAPNATAENGSAVDLVMGKGPEMAAVPTVVGMTEAEAIASFEQAGLEPQSVPGEFNSDLPANVVSVQTPAGGLTVEKSSAVTYVLSLGPEPTIRSWDDQRRKPRKQKDNRDDD